MFISYEFFKRAFGESNKCSDFFFYHFGNGTSTGSIGKNSVILPANWENQQHLSSLVTNGTNIVISVTVFFFFFFFFFFFKKKQKNKTEMHGN